MISSLLRRHETSLLLAIVCVMAVTTGLDAQYNYLRDPLASGIDLLRHWSMLSLFALGAAIVIIAGGIDLSTGSVIAISGTVCGAILLLLAPDATVSPDATMPLWVSATAILGTLCVGFLIGSLHAWLITAVGLPPFVATLATLVGLRSLARALCSAVTETPGGGSSSQINVANLQFRYLANSLWIPVLLVIVLSLLLWLMLSRTVLGRHLYALGGNEQAARLSGIATDRLKWVAYCLSAMLASLSGILYVCDQSVAEPQTLGRGYELNAIAAAVVGGCSLQGGVGTIPGTLLGSLFLRAVIDGVAKIIDSGADVYEGLIVGVVVVFAVAFTRAGSSSGPRPALFAGALGGVTILNLTVLSGLLMALVGSKLLADRLVMNAAWLAGLTMLCVLGLMAVSQGAWFAPRRRLAGVAWAIATVTLFIGADRAYPLVQRSAAQAVLAGFGAQLTAHQEGWMANLRSSSVTDADFATVMRSLQRVPQITAVDLSGTAISDAALDHLAVLKSVRTVDLTGTKCTASGLRKLSRKLPNAQVTGP